MLRLPRATWIVIVVTGLLAMLGSVMGNIGATALTWLSPQVALVLFVLISLSLVGVSLWYEQQKAASEPSVDDAHENREIMLGRVKDKWITGFLDNPLYHSYDEQLLALPLCQRVGSRFDLVLSNPIESTQTIPSGTTITQVFDQAGGELLILGEPGAGKTTLLLELARDLLKRANDNPMALIPVVLMLSSWAAERLSLEEWIVEELRTKYDVRSQIGKEWVKANQLLLLLDGLDEVAPDVLSDCIEAINKYYRQAHRSLVVCSQTKDFLEQSGRLAFRTAVIVQSLSSEQVDTYLDSLMAKGEDIKGLKHVLHQNEALRTLAAIPFFLTVLILAYHGKSTQELLALVNAMSIDQQHLLFHNYIERSLQREGTRIHTPAQQTKNWLSWLASQMTAHQQSELYLERLQLDWLPKRYRIFYQWSILLLGGLVCLFCGLVGGLRSGLASGLLGGLVGGLAGVMFTWLTINEGGGQIREIEPAEALAWSWKGPFYGLVSGLLVGLCVGKGVGQGSGMGTAMYLGQGVGLRSGLVSGMCFGLIFGLLFGFSRKQLNKRSMLSPNEGIQRSLKNGLFFGLLIGLLVGLFVGLFVGLGPGLIFGLAFGLFFGLNFGLGDTVQHYTLRFWLWHAGCTPAPWRYVAFLDDTVDQLLMRKVGGGYIFRHRLLQDYFSSLNVISPQKPPVRAEAN